MTVETTSHIDSSDAAKRRWLPADVWWRALAAISVVTLAVVNVIVAQTAIAPRTPWDEVFPLETARLLAGRGTVTEMAGAGYYPGWAIVLTPIWWISSDPGTVYRIAVAVVIVLAIFTVLPLSLLLRRLSLTQPQAVVAASLALLLPARTVNADYALSENLLTLLYVLTVLAAVRMWEKPGVWRVVLFVLGVTASYLTHVRALALVIAAVIWLVLFLKRNWRLAGLGLVLTVAGYYLVKLLVALITVPLLLTGFGQDDKFFSHLGELSVSLAARVALTQLWAQFAGSFGVFGLGLVLLVIWSVRELRRWTFGPSTFLLGFFLVTFAVSVIAWSTPGPQDRLDAQLYTRYIDSVALLVVAVAVAILIRGAKRWVLLLTAALVMVDVAVVWLRVAPWANTWGTAYGPANSAAVLAWFRLAPDQQFAHPLLPLPGNANQMWFWASLSVLAGLAVLVVLRRHVKILSFVLLLAFTALSLCSNPSQVRDYPAAFATTLEKIDAAMGEGDDYTSVDFDLSCHGPYDTYSQVLNWSGYWLYPREVEGIDPEVTPFDSDLVISCDNWTDAEKYGALEVKGTDYYSYSLWVLPGAVQDTLVRDGMVEESR